MGFKRRFGPRQAGKLVLVFGQPLSRWLASQEAEVRQKVEQQVGPAHRFALEARVVPPATLHPRLTRVSHLKQEEKRFPSREKVLEQTQRRYARLLRRAERELAFSN